MRPENTRALPTAAGRAEGAAAAAILLPTAADVGRAPLVEAVVVDDVGAADTNKKKTPR